MSQREVVKVANLEIPADLIGLLNTVAGTDSEGVGGGVSPYFKQITVLPSSKLFRVAYKMHLKTINTI